jgi:uncharacterized protein (DUF1697 family)
MTAVKRYAALLRGVSPMNAKMPELKRCFEAAGFSDVKTVLSSGNVVFGAAASSEAALQRKAEAAMSRHLDRSFVTIVRSLDALRELLDADPYAAFDLAPGSKRVVTFLRGEPSGTLTFPVEFDGARILCLRGREVLSAYVPSPRGPVFMQLIEKTFGQDVTTRTWDTVRKVVGDHPGGAGDRATAAPAKRPAAKRAAGAARAAGVRTPRSSAKLSAKPAARSSAKPAAKLSAKPAARSSAKRAPGSRGVRR